MLKFIYVIMLPIILLDISVCNQICMTYFPGNKNALSLEADLRMKRSKADLCVSAGLSQMTPFRDLVTNWNFERQGRFSQNLRQVTLGKGRGGSFLKIEGQV